MPRETKAWHEMQWVATVFVVVCHVEVLLHGGLEYRVAAAG
jgi:hypothetical protein